MRTILQVPIMGCCKAEQPLRRLVLAQDTGGAIRGGVRGDLFWGHGARAAAISGRMKNAGRWFLFLPRALAERLEYRSNEAE